MDKTKKNGILKAAACVFGSTMLMTCVLGGTLAKYASNADNISATVKAAKWEVNAQAEKTLAGQVKWNVDRCSDYKGTLVKDSEDNGQACPGTWGYAKVNLVNTGDVAADVTIGSSDLAVPSSENLKFYVGLASGDPSEENDVKTLGSVSDPIQLKKGESKDILIAYVWDYDTAGQDGTQDTADTALQGTEIKVLNGEMTIKIDQSKTSNDDVEPTA